MAEQAVNSLEFLPQRIVRQMRAVPDRLAEDGRARRRICSRGGSRRERWNDELLPLIAELGRRWSWRRSAASGRSVPVPLRTAINYFDEDVTKHLSDANPPAQLRTNGSKR